MNEKDDLLARLKKVEGQIRGIHKMIDEERDCSDVITQLLAASRALDKVGFLVASRSIKQCAAVSNVDGRTTNALDEAIGMLMNLAKRSA